MSSIFGFIHSYEDLYKITGIFSSILNSLKTDSNNDNFQFVPTDQSIALMHERIKMELHKNFEGDFLVEKLAEFKELFDLQYKIYGYNIKNPYYTMALETFYGWAELLSKDENDNILSSVHGSTIAELSRFYTEGENAQKFAKVLNVKSIDAKL